MYNNMSKEELLRILQSLLKTDATLTFLLYLKKDELERLVAKISGFKAYVQRNTGTVIFLGC